MLKPCSFQPCFHMAGSSISGSRGGLEDPEVSPGGIPFWSIGAGGAARFALPGTALASQRRRVRAPHASRLSLSRGFSSPDAAWVHPAVRRRKRPPDRSRRRPAADRSVNLFINAIYVMSVICYKFILNLFQPEMTEPVELNMMVHISNKHVISVYLNTIIVLIIPLI